MKLGVTFSWVRLALYQHSVRRQKGMYRVTRRFSPSHATNEKLLVIRDYVITQYYSALVKQKLTGIIIIISINYNRTLQYYTQGIMCVCMLCACAYHDINAFFSEGLCTVCGLTASHHNLHIVLLQLLHKTHNMET